LNYKSNVPLGFNNNYLNDNSSRNGED